MFQALGLALPNRDALLEAESRRAQIGDAGLRRDIDYGEYVADLRAAEAQRGAQRMLPTQGMPEGYAIPESAAAAPAAAPEAPAAPKAGLPANMPPAASAAAAQTDRMRGASRKAAKQQADQAWPGLGTGADILTYPFRLGQAVANRLVTPESDEARRVTETRRSGVIEKTAAELRAGSAAEAQLTPEFFARQRMVESGNNAAAVSPKGAVGTMQTMPGTLRDPGFGVTPARDNSPAELQRVGEDYMRAMTRRYGDVTAALIAYNWGPANTDRWLAAGANPNQLPAETRGYVQKMLGGQQAAQPQAVAGLPTPSAQAAAPAAPAAPQYSPVAMPTGALGLTPRDVAMAQAQLQQIEAEFNATRDVKQRAALQAQHQQVQASLYESQLSGAMRAASMGDERALSSLAQAAGIPIMRVGGGRYAVAQLDPASGQYVPNQALGTGTAEQMATQLFGQLSAVQRAARAKAAEEQAKATAQAQGKVLEAAGTLPYKLQELRAKGLSEQQVELIKAGIAQGQIKDVVTYGGIGGRDNVAIVRGDGSIQQIAATGAAQQVDGMTQVQ